MNLGDKMIFREDFQSTQSVIANGGVLTNATVSNGVMTCSGGGANYEFPSMAAFWEVGGTIRMRIRTDDTTSSNYRFFTYGIDVNRNLTLAYNPSTGTYFAQMRIASGDNYYIATNTAGAQSTLHEIVVTWDVANTTITIYKNGSFLTDDNTAGAISIAVDTNYGKVNIGKTNASWVGEIHVCEVFLGTVWTADEVADAYTPDTYQEVDASQCPLYCKFNSAYNDGSNNVTGNIGTTGVNLILGNGSGTNAPTLKYPQGYTFTSGNYITHADNDLLDFANGQDFSIVLAVKGMTDAGAAICVGQKIQGDNGLMGIVGNFGWDIVTRMDLAGNLSYLRVRTTDNITAQVPTTTDFATSGIKFCVFTFKWGDTMKVFVNGVQEGSTSTTSLTGNISSTGKVYLGKAGTSGLYNFTGDMYRPAIYREALTPRQIRWLTERFYQQINQ